MKAALSMVFIFLGAVAMAHPRGANTTRIQDLKITDEFVSPELNSKNQSKAYYSNGYGGHNGFIFGRTRVGDQEKHAKPPTPTVQMN